MTEITGLRSETFKLCWSIFLKFIKRKMMISQATEKGELQFFDTFSGGGSSNKYAISKEKV